MAEAPKKSSSKKKSTKKSAGKKPNGSAARAAAPAETKTKMAVSDAVAIEITICTNGMVISTFSKTFR